MEKVSIIIQNWNGEEYIEDCLKSIYSQEYENVEVIVVDSASKDRSVEIIRDKFRKVLLVELKEDKGAPYANNIGCRRASGKYLMILNNDTMLKKDTITKLVSFLESNPDSVASPLQLNWEGTEITGAGCPHYWIGSSLYNIFRRDGDEPFYLSIACCMLTKDLFERFPFNENLFFYEEVEWAWRMRMHGIRLRIIEDAFFHHKIGGTTKSRKFAFNVAKSITATHYICFSSISFCMMLPVIAYNYAALIMYHGFMKRDMQFVRYFAKGLISFLTERKKFSLDRHHVQKGKKTSDLPMIMKMISSEGFVRKFVFKGN